MNATHYILNGEQQPAQQRFFKWSLLPLCMVLVCAGCKHEDQVKVTAGPDPSGTYALVSVDGTKVPCNVQHEGHALAINSGSFVINADGTCCSTMVFSPPSHGEVTNVVKATFTREGQKLTMKWQGAGMTTGTVEGDMFTMNNEGMVFAYRK
jgi:hypothetical protein